MATTAPHILAADERMDVLTGTPRASGIDRWIFVFMAAFFIAIVLAGFIPSALGKIAAVQAGQRAPFPMVLHMHAVLMGTFLMLLLAQTWLMATGRPAQHMRLGVAGMVLVPAIVVVGFALVPTMYYQLWGAAQFAPEPVRTQLQGNLSFVENILLLQLRVGILFPLFIAIGLMARRRDSGLHKRMMILGTATALPAGIDRIPWIPHTLPESALSADLYTLLAVSPLFAWDVIRNGYVHRAYIIWGAVMLPFALIVHALWDTPGWHTTAKAIMGV